MKYKRPFFWCEKIPRKRDAAVLCPDFDDEKECERRRQYSIKLLKRFLADNKSVADLDDDMVEVNDFVPDYLDEEDPWDKTQIERHRQRRRHRIFITQVRKLLKLLLSCKPGRECGSGACHVCTRQYRRWHVAALLRLVKIGTPLLLFTFAPGDRVKAEDFKRKHCLSIRKRLLRQLARACPDSAQGVGWVDNKVRLAGFFEPHIHMIVFGCTAQQLKDAEPGGLRSREAPGAKRKGKPVNPWDVEPITAGEEPWTIAYTVRQLPKRNEAFFKTRQFRDQYDPLEVRHLLFKHRCKMKHRLVLFRVRNKSGTRFRSNVAEKEGK